MSKEITITAARLIRDVPAAELRVETRSSPCRRS